MLHIHAYNAPPNALHLILEGALDAVHVAALQEALRTAGPLCTMQLVLHCDALQAIDDRGLCTLAQLKHDGATLEGVPLLISWKLHLLDQQAQSKE